jgi:hypothetical protein
MAVTTTVFAESSGRRSARPTGAWFRTNRIANHDASDDTNAEATDAP